MNTGLVHCCHVIAWSRRGFRRLLSLLVLAAIGSVPVAWAADAAPAAAVSDESLRQQRLLELMDVTVSTVSRVDEQIDHSPGSVYVFTREVIRKRGYRSLGELLQTVPGFTVFHRDLQYVAGVRGLNANDNEKITLLINGQELNQVVEPDYLNGPINLDNVERVEVVVGPSSFFQQANTLAATVNVITRDVDGTEVVAATGTALPYSGTLLTGKRWAEDRFLSLSFTTERQEGFDAWDAGFKPNLAGRELTGEIDQPNYFSVLKGQLGELSGQVVAYRTTFPELLLSSKAPRGTEGDYVDQFYSVFLQDDHPLTLALDWITKVSVANKQSKRTKLDGTPEDISNAQWDYGAETGLRYTGFEGHLLQLGIQGSYEHNYNTFFRTPGFPEETLTLVDSDSQAVGVYADDTWQVMPKAKVIGGLRLDYNSMMEGDRWFPGGRAALILDPTEKWITKLLYNRAVRMPAPWASPLNTGWGSNNPGSPGWAANSPTAREPEKLETVEWQNIFYIGTLRLGATVYYQWLEDFITWYGPHTNAGDFEGHGVELNLQAPLEHGLTLWGNASYNKSEFVPFDPNSTLAASGHGSIIDQEGRLVGAPEYMANAGFDYEITPRLIVSPGVRYFTKQTVYDNDKLDFSTIDNRYYLDTTLTWRNAFRRDMDVSLSGKNLLNNRDPVATQWLGGTYMPRGLTVVLTVEVRF